MRIRRRGMNMYAEIEGMRKLVITSRRLIAITKVKLNII